MGRDSERVYYHYDGLGSVSDVTSASGVPTHAYSYEPFGSPRTALKLDPLAPDNPMQFTGEYLDPTGLYHLRARQYDPSLGRVTGLDPFPPAAAVPYVSPYVYVDNRPTVFIDPSGMIKECSAQPNATLWAGSAAADLQWIYASAQKDDDHHHFQINTRFYAPVSPFPGANVQWNYVVDVITTTGPYRLGRDTTPEIGPPGPVPARYTGWTIEGQGTPTAVRVALQALTLNPEGVGVPLPNFLGTNDYVLSLNCP